MASPKVIPMRQDREGAAARGRAPAGVVLGIAAVVVLVAGLTAALAWWPSDTDAGDQAVQEFTHVHGLAIPAWDFDAVYVATHQGLVRIDAQGAWRWVGRQRHDFMGFSAHPTEEGVLYSSGHPDPDSDLPNPIGFMVSADGGATWQPHALAGQADLHVMATGSSGEVVYGWNVASQPGLYRSGDSGDSWQQLPATALAEAGGATALAVSPDDADVVWAATESGLVRSDDGGGDWEAVQAGPVTAVALGPTDTDRILTYVAAPEHGLMASRDGGESWSRLELTLEDDAVSHLAIHPDHPDLVYAATVGGDLLRSRDGGQSWDVLARDGQPEGR